MKNLNNEVTLIIIPPIFNLLIFLLYGNVFIKLQGFTAASESECDNGLKPVYWTDDSNDDGVAIRRGSVECGQFLTT